MKSTLQLPSSLGIRDRRGDGEMLLCLRERTRGERSLAEPASRLQRGRSAVVANRCELHSQFVTRGDRLSHSQECGVAELFRDGGHQFGMPLRRLDDQRRGWQKPVGIVDRRDKV